ncbi:hypothetical protein D9M71_838870 [compost metagenome]
MGGLQGNDQHRHIVPTTTEVTVQYGGYYGGMAMYQAGVVLKIPARLQAVAVHDQ